MPPKNELGGEAGSKEGWGGGGGGGGGGRELDRE